jgi:arginase
MLAGLEEFMKTEIYGVPMDLGGNLRGTDMGPAALRIAGLKEALLELGHEVVEFKSVKTPERIALDPGSLNAKFAEEIEAVCRELSSLAYASKEKGVLPIFVGGDHSLAKGTISGVSEFFKKHKKDLGVIWFDAHADMNTPDTSPSGNVHGMPLAQLLGLDGSKPMLDPSKVCLVGIRDLDSKEREAVVRSGVHTFSMREIDSLGMGEVTKRALELAGKNTSGIHLSFDIDGLDPDIAPGVGTPVRGGVNFREAHLFMEMISDSKLLSSMDIVELNPIRDHKNETALTMVHLVESLFGKAIVSH